MTYASVVLDVGIGYSVMLMVGGIIGYVKAKSNASLIAGLVSGGICLLSSLVGLYKNGLVGLFMLAVCQLVMSGFFYKRYAVSGKFMPAGMMCLASITTLILSFVGILVV